MRTLAACVSIVLVLASYSCPAQNSVETKSTGITTAESLPSSESWTELDALKSGLSLSHMAWVVLGKSEYPEYTSELVRVQWRDADPIELHVVLPHGVTKPPVILYLYSASDDGSRFTQNAWCKYVTKDGFAAVGFVSALTGQRYHARPMRQWFVSELQESLGTSTHDVQMILNYLVQRGDMDTARVGMLGEGSGGTISILAAAVDPRIRFVDAIHPWGDWPDWLKSSPLIPEQERASYLQPEFLRKVMVLDPVKYLPELSRDRVRIEQVDNDPITPREVQKQIAASASAKDVVLQYSDMRSQIYAWMMSHPWLEEKLSSTSLTTAETSFPEKP